MKRFGLLTLCILWLSAGSVLAQGPGLYELELLSDHHGVIGTVSTWNSPTKLHIKIIPSGDWLVVTTQIYAGTDPVPLKKGVVVPGRFPYKSDYDPPAIMHDLVLDLREELDMTWGAKSEDERTQTIAVHADLMMVDGAGNPILDEFGEPVTDDAWAFGPIVIADKDQERCYYYIPYHPMRGQFVDSPVQGLSYLGPTQEGITGSDETGGQGGFLFFPAEVISFSIGSVPLGSAPAVKKVSPLDLFPGADTGDPRVVGVARTLQTLDADSGALAPDGQINLLPEVVACFEGVVGPGAVIDFGNDALVTDILTATVAACNGAGGSVLAVVDAVSAQGNLEAGLNASGIFRKNLSKTEDLGESKQKLDVMPVYFPGVRSNGDPSLCVDVNDDGIYDETEDTLGVPYEEWRLNGDPAGEECDPRDYTDGSCVITLIECREVAKPLVVTYTEGIDLSEATTDFNACGEDLPDGVPCRFSNDIYTAVSRDDGTTWKRMNVSRMADLSSFELETGEPFPGTSGSPYLKINDNYLLVVWQSKFCKSGNPRYAINICDELDQDYDGDGIADSCEICRETSQGTICEYDYPYDNPYHTTDIWGVRGQQRSVDYDEVDDVADLGIGEIPYSCLWAARGALVTQKDLDDGTYASLIVEDDPATPDVDETRTVVLGDIIWYKPERLTSGRRDAYIPVVGSARGAGFAIAWQEDPSGLRPGKGKGPGQGWSGAISNHKSDIWYTYLSFEDFATVDADFVPGGPGDDPNGEASFDERPGLGRPKPLVPFSLPVRVSDNDMVNTHTLKVEASANCVTPPDGAETVCFPEVLNGTFVPLDTDEIAIQFCDHPNADPATCCDPDNHEGDPNCEDLKGMYGNLTGTKRFAYMARSIDDDGDGVPDYQYFVDRGGVLDLCDTSGANSYMDLLPGTSAHERWYGFANVAGASKLVCVTSDGRLLDGDVSASRPNIQMQPYTKPDGTRSAWVLLGYEESKGMGHSLAAGDHDDTDNPVDEIVGTKPEDPGQDKGFKQDIGKNVIYHSFDFAQPDLVAPGHIVNLPALCGGLYPDYCGEDYDGTNPTCTCELGQPVPLYFDYWQDNGDGTGEWMPDETRFLQFRTEIARRTRFIVQSPGKMGETKTLGAIIFKQGQEGQGRPADVFIRRIVKSGSGNPYRFDNFECTKYLDETFALPACPNGAGSKPSAIGYSCNVWGEAYGDRLCGGVFTDPNGGYERRDPVNLTSADIDLSVDAGPDDDTPDDPTDDVYGTDKVLLWSQREYNLGDESYGVADTSTCDLASCAGMYSNARSHRGFIRGDFLVTAYAYSPNWAAARNGRDRYNFYLRRSFDGGQTWTTTPADLGGAGVNFCPEWRADPSAPDPDGTGNAPPVFDGFDPECVDWCAPCPDGEVCDCTVTGESIAAGAFQPAIKVSEFDNNKETSSDPRVGATPPTYPLDGRDTTLPILRFVEDNYVDNVFFVAWGAGDNLKSTGGTAVTPEAPPTDVYYTRSVDYGDQYLKIPWEVNGASSNFAGETVWRYQRLAWGDPEQGECQLRATSDGSKVYAIYHQMTPVEGDPDEPLTRWYPWEPEESHDNDLWFRRVIFWPDATILP